MSAQAPIENTLRAHALTGVEPAPRTERTPLAVVPTPSPRSGPGVMVLCALALLGALALVLVMNITLSNRQYALLDLRVQQQELAETNEQLAEKVGYLEAPQNLAARADALGMVTSGGTASLDVRTGEVTERPEGGAGDGLSATYVAPPVSADAAGPGESTRNGFEIDGPQTAAGRAAADEATPSESASPAPGEAAPSADASPAPSEGDAAASGTAGH